MNTRLIEQFRFKKPVKSFETPSAVDTMILSFMENIPQVTIGSNHTLTQAILGTIPYTTHMPILMAIACI